MDAPIPKMLLKDEQIPSLNQSQKVVVFNRDYLDQDIKNMLGVEYTEGFRFSFQGKILKYKWDSVKAFSFFKGKLFVALIKKGVLLDVKDWTLNGINFLLYLRVFEISGFSVSSLIKKLLVSKLPLPKH